VSEWFRTTKEKEREIQPLRLRLPNPNPSAAAEPASNGTDWALIGDEEEGSSDSVVK
jgi:hypothetical protein